MMSWTLDAGAHDRPESGVCLMEAVAWVAGEAHSDAPECACPVLAAYGRRLNDWLPHEQRQRLAVFVPRLVGSRASREVAQQRAYRLADAAVRVFASFALDALGDADEAATLRGLAPIIDKETAAAAAAVAVAANDAYDAAAATANATANAYATATVYAATTANVAATANAYDAANAYANVAVYAATTANAAATVAQPIWDKAIALLDELCPAPAATFARTQAEYATLVS